MSGQAGEEDGFVTHKITKTITYYCVPTAADRSLCPVEDTPSPPAVPTAPSPLPTGSTEPDSTPCGTDPPPLPLPSPSTPLLSTSSSRPSPCALLSDSPPTASPLPRPVVLLLPWLGARLPAVAKYRNLYLERGMDVLVVESDALHFLWPRWGLEYGSEVLRVLEDSRFSSRPLLIHATSIGGYTFAQMMVHMARESERYSSLAQRVIGHIYDSMVVGSLEHMAIGLGKTLLPRLESLVKHVAMLFFWLFKSHTADYYNHGLHVFHNSPVTAPALFFFCENDALCDPVAMESLIDFWSKRGVAVESRKWKESVHAAHLRTHPEDYLSTLAKFLNSLTIAPIRAKM